MKPRDENIVDFEIDASKSIKKWQVMIHSVALAACLSASAPIAIQFVSIVLIIISFIFNITRYTGSKFFLRFRSGHGWLLFCNDNYEVINILDGTVCAPLFIIINCSHQRHERYLFVGRDAMDRVGFRRLTVFLKIYGK